MIYFKALVLGIVALSVGVQAQAAPKAKDKVVGRLTLVKRKAAFTFADCKDNGFRSPFGYQCEIQYQGSKPYDVVANSHNISLATKLEVPISDTVTATASVFPADSGDLTFHFSINSVGGIPTTPVSEETIQLVKDAYAAQRVLVSEFYVQTVR